ncbi:MAG: hypothetical protein MK160_02530 [Rhodobacteraceae bacterium]|nr:hypothetical protein [Paracoccaceae bacterium]
MPDWIDRRVLGRCDDVALHVLRWHIVGDASFLGSSGAPVFLVSVAHEASNDQAQTHR